MAFWRSEPLRASRRATPRSPISNPRPHPSLPPPPQQVRLVRVDDPTDALALSESACAKRADTAAELDASNEAANVTAAETTAELAALLAPPPPPPPQQMRLVRIDDLTDTLALSESACTKRTDTAAELAASAEADTAAEPAAEPAALAAAKPADLDNEPAAEAVSFLKMFPSPERVART